MRVDLLSSKFGRASDYETSGNDGNDTGECLEDAEVFDPTTAGPPSLEPMFGAHYWRRVIPSLLINEWEQASLPELPPAHSSLSLPPKNPFVPEKLALKALPSDDSHHPLVHCSLKICVTVGKKKVRDAIRFIFDET